MRTLTVWQVDAYILHNPDSHTPLEETLSVISELYDQGKFTKVGFLHFNGQFSRLTISPV